MPVRLGDGIERLRPGDARVVDENVHPTEAAFDGRDQLFDGRALGNIGSSRQAPPAEAFNRPTGVGRVILTRSVRDGDVGACLCKRLGDRPSDPAIPARDERDAAGEWMSRDVAHGAG